MPDLMIVLDLPSYQDLQKKTLLSDYNFDKLLQQAGIRREHAHVTALIRQPVPGQDFEPLVARSRREAEAWGNAVPLHDKQVRPVVATSLERLEREIALIQPKLILTLGNGPLFALTGRWGIGKWRGSLLAYGTILLLPTYSPSYLNSSWKDRAHVSHDLSKAAKILLSPELCQPPEWSFTLEADFETTYRCLETLLDKVQDQPTWLSVDIETRAGHCACIGLAWSSTEAICIPLMHSGLRSYWLEEEEFALVELLSRILTHDQCQVIGQNFIYDAQYFYRHFLFIPRLKHDTMLAQHTIWSNMPKGLDVLSSIYCPDHVYWKDESKDWDPKIGERQLWNYNCIDSARTFKIAMEQLALIESLSESWPELPEIYKFQQELFWPVLRAMNLGIRRDDSSRKELSKELQAAFDERQETLHSITEYPLNIKSPKQMNEFFYSILKLKPILNRQTKKPTVNDDALAKLAAREPLIQPICATISDMRSLGVFRSTFIEAQADIDNRIRCSFNIGGTETYRFASSKNAFGSGLNLQNIPKGDD